MCKGFIRLNRQLTEWEWFDNSQMVHIWIYFLLKANYQDCKWRGIDIPRGSFVTSLDAICKDTGLSLQNVRTCISRLKSTGEITIKVTNRFSIVTVCKYDEYNPIENETNKQTNKPANNQLTSKQQATNKQLTTDNNINNIINKEIIYNIKNKEELSNESKKKEKSSDLTGEFDDFRKKYKKYGGRVRGLDTELGNLKKKHADWREIIPLLSPALERENLARHSAEMQGMFFPQMKNLQTYINNRSWESYSDEEQAAPDGEYNPVSDGIFKYWNPERKCLMFNGDIDRLEDGYSRDNRPAGAKVAWGMYEWVWDFQKKEWVKQ